jgi:hypothetical protein
VLVQTDDQKESEIELRVQQRIAQLLDSDSVMPEMIASSVERALRRVLSDKELRKQFWEAGYQELSVHAGNNASQWIGKRLLTSAAIALTTALIVWLVRSGGLK